MENQIIVRNGHELAKLYEVEHIIKCADLSALASLERKESRWGETHYRTDYPERDDENWLKHIVLRPGEGPVGVKVETRAVQDSNA